MTFCVAWKTQTSSFIIGDSAVTTNSENIFHGSIESSFKEKQGLLDKDEYVFEGAYKIFSENNIGFALAGDGSFGRQLISEIIQRISLGINIEIAMMHAINNYPDFSSKENIEIIVAFFNEEPRLFSIKNKRIIFIEEEEGPVIIGKPLPDLVREVNELCIGSTNFWLENRGGIDNDRVFYIKILALLQGFGLFYYTMGQGIGGSYAGLFVNREGIEHQPDICYVITGENPEHDVLKFASVHINKNILCIINTDSNDLAISNHLNECGTTELQRFHQESVSKFDKGCFKYFIFLNKFLHVSTIVNMDYKKEHIFLNIDIRKEKPETLGLFISPTLRKYINNNFEDLGKVQKPTICYFPYLAPNKKIKNQVSTLKLRPRIGYQPSKEELRYKFIIQGNQSDQLFFGSPKLILPFIKHYRHEKKIIIVDTSTDFVNLEYENGDITFPENFGNLDAEIADIPPKLRNEDIYLFDLYTSDTIEQPMFITVLALNAGEAESKVKAKITNEFGVEQYTVYSGKIFYHPAFS